MKNKTKIVPIRMDIRLYNFIKEVAKTNNLTVSEFIRDIVVYFNMGYILGEFNKSYSDLRKEFIKKYGNFKNNDDNK